MRRYQAERSIPNSDTEEAKRGFCLLVGAEEMGQWVKALAAKSGDLSSNPGTHMVERTDSCK